MSTTSTEKQEYISLGSLCKGSIVATNELSTEIEKKISNNTNGTSNIAIGKASISNSSNSIAIGTNSELQQQATLTLQLDMIRK